MKPNKDLKTYVIAGTGSRGYDSFGKPILDNYPKTAKLIGLFDISPGRIKAANELLQTDLPEYTDFDLMLKELNPDAVIVCTKDNTHEEYVIKSLKADKRVIAEKPLCITAKQCREILKAKNNSKADGFVTHNMRYGPAVMEIKKLLSSGIIGKLLSMDFRETLDRHHGADYFRRWHKNKANSGGLLIHKASHHFDILNWFADSKAKTLSALGSTKFYGKNGPYRSDRCTGCPHSEKCDFFNDFKENPKLQALYFKNEEDDGYIRDGCVFDASIDTEDQANVIYEYENGVSACYSLIAYASYEGMLITFEGTEGRLEYEHVADTSWASRVVKGGKEKNYFNVGETKNQFILYRHNQSPQSLEIPKPKIKGGHGGADPSLRDEFFAQPWETPKSEKMATIEDAIQAVLIGVAANESIANGGQAVQVQDLLKENYHEASGI